MRDIIDAAGAPDPAFKWIDDPASKYYEYIHGVHVMVHTGGGFVLATYLLGERTKYGTDLEWDLDPRNILHARILGAAKMVEFPNLPTGPYPASCVGPGVSRNTRGLEVPVILLWQHPMFELVIAPTYRPFRNVPELLDTMRKGLVRSNGGGGGPIDGVLFWHPAHGFARLMAPTRDRVTA